MASSRSFGLSFESVEGGQRDTARFRCELPASPRVDRDIVWTTLENDLSGLTRDIDGLAR